MPIESDKVSRGFRQLVGIGSPADYRLGLARQGGGEAPDEAAGANSDLFGCQTLRSSVELVREEFDASGGANPVRQCKGLVQLNRCDGSCLSSAEPSVKAPNGVRKVSRLYLADCTGDALIRRAKIAIN